MYGVAHRGQLAPLEKAFWCVESPGHLLQVSASNLHLVSSIHLVSFKLQLFNKVYYSHASDDFGSTYYE